MKKILVSILTFILLLGGSLTSISAAQVNGSISPTIKKKMLDQFDLKDIDRLMIVAHPDDETIWGGNHIMKKNYLIVCVTNGLSKGRAQEFKAVMKKSGNPYIMLEYPDKTDGKRDSWESVEADIKKDLKTVIGYKTWKQIVTHNPDGEYGHIHHKMICKMVTDISKAKHETHSLMYFGKYYKKKNIKQIKEAKHLSKKQMKEKNALFKPYESQMLVKDHLYHMFPYENWQSYNQWNIEKSLSNLAEGFLYTLALDSFTM